MQKQIIMASGNKGKIKEAKPKADCWLSSEKTEEKDAEKEKSKMRIGNCSCFCCFVCVFLS